MELNNLDKLSDVLKSRNITPLIIQSAVKFASRATAYKKLKAHSLSWKEIVTIANFTGHEITIDFIPEDEKHISYRELAATNAAHEKVITTLVDRIDELEKELGKYKKLGRPRKDK